MRVLIWDKNIVLKNTGGPSGYLYNIHKYIKENSCNEIFFYSDFFKVSPPSIITPPKGFIDKIYAYLLRFWISLLRQYVLTEKLSKEEIELINQFEFIHVHSIEDMRKYFVKNDKIRSKIILSSHCPEPLIDELSSQSFYKNLFKNNHLLRNYFIKKEIEAFDAADYIMFPVEQAKEAYSNKSTYYERFFINNKNKFFYVPTAIVDEFSIPVSNFNYIEKSIKENNLCVCFIGRHSVIKGYDKLIQIANDVWSRSNEVTFVIGGLKSNIEYPNHDKWIELGWIKTSEVLNEIDLFILPNKQTYFDLILLEVLRQGVPILASNTGGNKWYKGKSRGVLLYDYDNVKEASDYIIDCLNYKKKGILSDLGKSNRILYETEFVLSRYIATYISSLNNLRI